MMKKIFFVVATFLLFIPSTVYATEQKLKDTAVRYIKEKEDGEYCIDLEEAYKQIGDESKALSGKDGGIENSKKANILATLVTIQNILGGTQGFCIKDEEAAVSSMTKENTGLLGFLSTANFYMIASFPTVNVTDHLAQTFIPGYKGNNSTMAQEKATTTDDICVPDGTFCRSACRIYDSTYKDEIYGKIRKWFYHEFSEDECVQRCLAADSCDAPLDPKHPEYTFLAMFNDETELATKCKQKVDKRVTDAIEEQLEKTSLKGLTSEFTNNDGEPVYAGQTGYSYLQNMHIDQIWSETRNIAYVLYVIILIVIGFMIMFRNKIGGQMMVSVSNSIPQIIVGLVLVTFSFAIVGIALDLGKTLIIVSNRIFTRINNGSNIQSLGSIVGMTDEALKKTNSGTGFINYFFDECEDFYKAAGVEKDGNGLPGQIGKLLGGGAIIALSDSVIQTAITDALSITGWLKLIINVVLTTLKFPVLIFFIYNLVVLLVCVYASFKLFITMLTTYIKIFMNVILAPFQILAGSIPGNSSALTNWFKSVFANILVFPAMYSVINFALYLGEHIGDTRDLNFFGNSGVLWPSFLANMKGVLLIGAYIFCSNLPGVINGFLKVGESKEMASAGESTKKALGKIPLIGGMFG